jgi:hypothetical protein
VEKRFQYHRTHRKVMTHNPALGAWLQDVTPLIEILDIVDESERYAREREAVRSFGARFDLLNRIWNGYSPSAETREKISQGCRRARERGKGANP